PGSEPERPRRSAGRRGRRQHATGPLLGPGRPGGRGRRSHAHRRSPLRAAVTPARRDGRPARARAGDGRRWAERSGGPRPPGRPGSATGSAFGWRRRRGPASGPVPTGPGPARAATGWRPGRRAEARAASAAVLLAEALAQDALLNFAGRGRDRQGVDYLDVAR